MAKEPPACRTCPFWDAPHDHEERLEAAKVSASVEIRGSCWRFPQRQMKHAHDRCGEHPNYVGIQKTKR